MLTEDKPEKTKLASATGEDAGKLNREGAGHVQRESANPTRASANSTGAAAPLSGHVRPGDTVVAEPAEVNAIEPAAEPFRQARPRGRSGPTSAVGKARVAQNALKHGLRSEKAVLPGEDPRAFEEVRSSVFAELRPEGEFEAFLAWRVASGIWRMSRLVRVEAELFALRSAELGPRSEGPGAAFLADCQYGTDSFSKLSRYEAEIDRGLFRAFHELQRLQAVRNGGAVPLPLAVDVNLSGPQVK